MKNRRKSGSALRYFEEQPPEAATPEDVLCYCPVCRCPYPFVEDSLRQHFVCDLCFSSNIPAGEAKGAWPTKRGLGIPVRFDVGVATLSELLETELADEQERGGAQYAPIALEARQRR